MSEMTDQVSHSHSDEERVSLASNGKTATRTLGKIGSTLRSSIRRVAEQSPPSPGSEGLKVAPPSPLAHQNKMTDTTDGVSQHSDEERASLGSNGKTPTRTLGKIGSTLRKSIRKVAERTTLSPGAKGSKVTTSREEPNVPPSPTPSSASMQSSSLIPAEDNFNRALQTPKGLKRSQTDPNMSRPGASIIKRMQSGRRSLGFSTKKEKNKTFKCDPVGTEAAETSATELKEHEEEAVAEEEQEEEEELDEAYTLPDIPHTPISVMQISNLIKMEVLEEAHLNLLAMRQELQKELATCGEDLPTDVVRKEQDLNLLYGDLRAKLTHIVRDSNLLPARNKPLLVYVARIIQEEEKRAKDPGGLPGSWKESWREAVVLGVQAKVESVHLDTKEQNISWLSLHLGLLGKAIVEDLEKVRRELRWSYPPSFKVFGTYVASYHRVVGQHLKKLEQQAADVKDLYALLNWIINSYKSERIMGSPSLQLDMENESSELLLEEGFLKRLKDKYCCKMKVDLSSALDRVTGLQQQDVWDKHIPPQRENNYLTSEIPMDIWTIVKGQIVNARNIDAELEQRVTSSCLEELAHFPQRFEREFRHHCDPLRPQPLWVEYHISYINSFSALLRNTDEYKDSCPAQVDAFRKKASGLIGGLVEDLENQFKDNVKPYLRRMLTRRWLTNDDDFTQLRRRTERLSQDCSAMSPDVAKEFASRLHFHVVKEYVGQLMKKNYSCNNRRHERAASKMQEQLDILQDLYLSDMKSEHEFLHGVGDDLSGIIGQKDKRIIKNQLPLTVRHYPDFREFGLALHDDELRCFLQSRKLVGGPGVFSTVEDCSELLTETLVEETPSDKKHLVAVLHFRGLKGGRERQLILQTLSELKTQQNRSVNDSRVLFADMQVAADTDCLSDLPFSCLSFFQSED